MAHLAAHFRVQDGQVAFQQRAGHAGQAGGRLGQAGEPGGEPGYGPGPGSGRAGRQPGGQLPADVPLGQFPQPGLGDRRKADGGLGLVDAQVAEPPDVPRVLGVPARAERERLDAAARVEDERAPAAPVSRRAEGGPPFLGLFQQGGRARAGQDRDERVNFPGRQLRVLLVAAALQDVLHLQPEPGGQRRRSMCSWPGPGFSQEAVNSSISGRPLPSSGCRGRSRTPTCPGSTRSSSRSGRPAAARLAAAAEPVPASPPGPGIPRDATG